MTQFDLVLYSKLHGPMRCTVYVFLFLTRLTVPGLILNIQLYYTLDSYHQLMVKGHSENDNPQHASHCFEYLRNNILCNLDMTLEGSMLTPEDKERGQPHVYRNKEEVLKWIESRRTDDLQDIIGP